ncbi:MAG: polyprenyl synthetase family protein [Thermodesulfobacteriota bacterium]
MRIQEVMDLLKDDVRLVEESFTKNLNSDVWLVGKVGEYILASGGKRFRPLIMLLCARLFDYKGDLHIDLAAVIEYIHTATLLHDDVVDNANLRRGTATANVVWGDGASVLVGDYLLSRAFSLAVCNGNERILQVLSRTTTGMAEGEIKQLLKHGDIETTEEEYLEVVTNKTAVLFAASSQVAAMISGATLGQESALSDYGMSLGIAYQLMDDCLDYISTDADLGKSIGNDIREGKVTMPLIHAYGKADEAERSFLKQALESEQSGAEVVKDVVAVINRHGGIEYTRKRALEYIARAKNNLELFKPDVAKMSLLAVADYVVDRKN